MLIDSFTVVAQIVNVLVLVLLLKHFLYGPITRAMAQRERAIAERLEQADQQEAMARQEAARLQSLQQDFAAHQDQRLAQLRSQLEDQRFTLLKQAEAEVDAARGRWYRALEQEKGTVLRTFRQQAVYQLTQLVRQMLTDLADTTLEQQIAKTFVNRLKQLPESEKHRLRTALSQADGVSVMVRSSVPLEASTQYILTEAIQAGAVGQIPAPLFEIDATLGCGIELSIPGYKLDWNVSAYLNDLEHNLALTLDQQGAPSRTTISA